MKVRIKPYILTICNNCSRCYDEIKCIKLLLEVVKHENSL